MGNKERLNNPFFDALNSIAQDKKYWLNKENERSYSPIGINIGLSQHIDSILFVNEMNMWWQVVTKRMHYDYLYHTIRQMRRPAKKWAKQTKDEDIDKMMAEHRINRQRAIEYLHVLKAYER